MQKRCTVDLWTAGYAGSRLTAQARSPMDKPWTTLRVAHRLPTGRRLPTSSTALNPIVIESGKVKTKTPAPALAYSSPVAVQTTGTTARCRADIVTAEPLAQPSHHLPCGQVQNVGSETDATFPPFS